MATRAEIVAQHDLIYETAPRCWQDGFPIGNGHFGALVYQPDGIEFAIGKLDVWDRRADYPAKVPFDRIKQLARENPDRLRAELAAEKPGPEVVKPAPKPCGRLSIELDDWFIAPRHTIFRQEQRLHLYEGLVSAEYELAGKAARCTALVTPDANVLVVNMEDTWTHDSLGYEYTQRVTLSREIDAQLGLPESGYDDGVAWLRYRFPDGFTYVLALRAVGADVGAPEVVPGAVHLPIRLDYGRQRRCRYGLLVTAATSLDADDPMAAARSNLDKAQRRGYPRTLQKHHRWWRAFWEKSAIELDNKLLEAVWYYSLYALAATSRGPVAPGLFGLWNAEKSAPWCGDYHGDINMVMTYWPIFSANHIELGAPFFATFERLAPIAQKQTRDWYGIDGLKYPIATLDTGAELCTDYYRLMQCTTAFYGLVFWQWFQYTQDLRILREHVFPILREGSKFYLALTQQSGDSLLIGPSWAPEQGPLPAYNVNNDLGLIKPFWAAFVAACDLLDTEAELKKQIAYCLERFPEYPAREGEFLDSLTAGDFIGLNHPGLLAMVVPGEDVDAESALAATARRTLRNFLKRTNRRSFADRRSSSCDLSWPWLLAIAAKLRDVRYAQQVLMDIGIGEYLKPNGMFAFIGGDSFNSGEEKRRAYDFPVCSAAHAMLSLSSCRAGKRRTMSMIQQGSGYLYAINEMLMQSHRGVIRIFPTMPKCLGDAAFEGLRAEGGFLVSARRKKGKTRQVVVKSLVGRVCRLRIYGSGDPAEITLYTADGAAVAAARVARKTWEFATRSGETYAWAAKGKPKGVNLKAGPAAIRQTKNAHGHTVTYGSTGHLYQQS